MLHAMLAPDRYGQLGFIGLGAMGLPMARNLLAAGARVGLTGRTPAKAASLIDPGADLGEQVGVGAGGGGVVLAARAHVGGPQRPAVRGGDDLDVAAVMVVLARPPQIHPGGRAGVWSRSV